jgi:hypothetical protein
VTIAPVEQRLPTRPDGPEAVPPAPPAAAAAAEVRDRRAAAEERRRRHEERLAARFDGALERTRDNERANLADSRDLRARFR